ncbi:MAG: hypothetical protein ACKPE1_29960, partial [Dolichospermum sp.]
LEKEFGWKGICVEPSDYFFEQLVRNRPNSICEQVCLSNQVGTVTFIEGSDETVSPYLSGIKSNLETVKYQGKEVVAKGKEVVYDAEHFFDGYRLDADYTLATIIAAAQSGAHVIVLCDTNGG